MDMTEVAARLEIEDLLVSYNRYGDTGRIDDVIALFAPDAQFDVTGVVYNGHDEIRAFFDRTVVEFATKTGILPGAHHTNTRWIEIDSDEVAQSGCRFVYIAVTGPDHWGSYRDELRRVNDTWLIAQRRVRVDGYAETSQLKPT